MSIHVINTTLTFCWSLNATDETLVKADFDILLSKPDGSATYTNDGLTTFTAPTPTSNGEATFDLLVDQLGRYQVTLSIGASDDYLVKALREVFIVDPPAYVSAGTTAKTTRGPEIIPPIPPIPALPLLSWEEVDNQPFVSNNTSAIKYTNGVLFMGETGSGGGMAYSTDGGNTWTQLTSGVTASINFIDENCFVSGGNIGYSSDYLTQPFSLSATFPTNWQFNIPYSSHTVSSVGNFNIYRIDNISPYFHLVYSAFPGGISRMSRVAGQEQGGYQIYDDDVMQSLDASFGNINTFYTESPATTRITAVCGSKWADNPVSCWGHLNGKITHWDGTAYSDTAAFSTAIQNIAISSYSGIMVANSGLVQAFMYISDIGQTDSWTTITNGLGISISEIVAVDEGHGHAFVARATDGKLYRSAQ